MSSGWPSCTSFAKGSVSIPNHLLCEDPLLFTKCHHRKVGVGGILDGQMVEAESSFNRLLEQDVCVCRAISSKETNATYPISAGRWVEINKRYGASSARGPDSLSGETYSQRTHCLGLYTRCRRGQMGYSMVYVAGPCSGPVNA